MVDDEARQRFQGCMVGLAIGDALGRPVEFYNSIKKIEKKFGSDGVVEFAADRHPPGTFTDDTQMSLAVARALLKAGHRSLDELMHVMASEFVIWYRSPDNDRAPGNTCLAGCHRLDAGVHWRQSGIAESKGCGSAMRSAPIGLYYHKNENKLIEVARASSLPTHGHPTALAAAAATALLVAWALHHDDPSDYPQRLSTAMRDMNGGTMADLIERIPAVLADHPDDVLCQTVLGEAWTGESAVASALYCFCRSPEDYRKTVLTGANTVGDSDSIACIAGAISGAYNGIYAIPKHWREQVESAAMLHEVAADLLAAHNQLSETQ